MISQKQLKTEWLELQWGIKILSGAMHEVFFETLDIKEIIWEEIDKFLNKIFLIKKIINK